MFIVYYNSIGNIANYGSNPDEDCPEGCKRLKFNDVVPGFLNSNGSIMMKVDVDNEVLVLINPQTIPAPIE